jgi:hypothetical protein
MPAPRVTVDLLRRYLTEGRGCGHGEAYRAFIQLKRWNASPVSVQTYGSVPPFERPTHFLCRSEWLIALLLAWIGCHVREQLPMWPWRSPHLLHGLDAQQDNKLKWSSGTIALSRELGIRHGCFVGTSIPYIWTLDLVATLAWLSPEQRSAAVVSIKPLEHEQYFGDVDPIARGPEKLEVERRFAQEIEVPYFVGDRTLYPGPLLGQLELYKSAANLPCGHRICRARDQLLETQGSVLDTEPPMEWRDRLVTDWELAQHEADLAVHSIFWHQLIDVDLSREIQMEDRIRPGGWALRDALRRFIQGAAVCPR